MGLFQKKPVVATKPLYTSTLNKNIMIVGLGNPGKEYAKSRHNLGFVCLDHYAHTQEFPKWNTKKDLKCQVTTQTTEGKKIILVKPQTYMNRSGEAIRAIQQFYEISPSDILVVYDDIDIEFGQIRMRQAGSSAGHNGLKSLIENIGENFGRVRIGIGPKKPARIDSADFVLANFTKDQQAQLEPLKKETTSLITEYIATGTLPHDTRNFIF